MRTRMYLVLLVGLLLAVSSCNQPSTAQLALARLETERVQALAQQKESAARVAETVPDVVRETYAGQTILTIAQTNAKVTTSTTDALIALATEEMRARESWRLTGQIVLWLLVSFVGMSSLALFTKYTRGEEK